jgi:hypothetical protein
VINDEANQAHQDRHDPAVHGDVDVHLRPRRLLPKTRQFLSGDKEQALHSLETAVPGVLTNDAFPRGAVERSVLCGSPANSICVGNDPGSHCFRRTYIPALLSAT